MELFSPYFQFIQLFLDSPTLTGYRGFLPTHYKSFCSFFLLHLTTSDYCFSKVCCRSVVWLFHRILYSVVSKFWCSSLPVDEFCTSLERLLGSSSLPHDLTAWYKKAISEVARWVTFTGDSPACETRLVSWHTVLVRTIGKPIKLNTPRASSASIFASFEEDLRPIWPIADLPPTFAVGN